MAPPAGFWRRGVTKAYFVPSIASLAAMTVAEVTAGTRLDEAINDLAGFTFNNNPITTPVLSRALDTKIPGPDQLDDSTFTFLEAKASNPLQTTLAKGTSGYIVFFPGGTAGASPAAADKYHAWPVTTTGWAPVITMGADPATWRAGVTITDTPSLAGVVAA
jgi:hypothetical protein